MSSTNKTANLQLSQFIGTDIPSILTDYNGDMRKIDEGVQEAKNSAAGAVSDLSALTGRVTNNESDISALNGAVNGLGTRVTAAEGNITNINSVIPSNASTSNKLATIEDIGGSGAITELEARVATAEDNINGIEAVIPSDASASNKLATVADIPVSTSVLIERFSPSTNETFPHFTNRIATAIKNAIANGVNPYDLGLLIVYPANQKRMLCVSNYNISSEISFEGISSGQNYRPCFYRIELDESSQDYSILSFITVNMTTYAPTDTHTAGDITGYEVAYDSAVVLASSSALTFELYKLR